MNWMVAAAKSILMEHSLQEWFRGRAVFSRTSWLWELKLKRWALPKRKTMVLPVKDLFIATLSLYRITTDRLPDQYLIIKGLCYDHCHEWNLG